MITNAQAVELEKAYFARFHELAIERHGVTESDEAYHARVREALRSGIRMEYLVPEDGSVL